VSNQDWPGPYWQQNDDADAGRRSRHGSQAEDQSPWDDAGFWRSDDRRSGQRDVGRWGRGEERARRPGHSQEGTGRSGSSGSGRFSQTADDLRNRLGLRGSAVSRGRSRDDDQAADEDFWGEAGRGRSGGSGSRESGRGGRGTAAGSDRGRTANGYDGNGRAANGRGAANGHGAANGYGAANGRAANGYGAGNGRAANGRGDRNGWDGAQTQGWQENGSGRGGYRGTRRAGAGGAANGGAANGGAANGGAANGGAANGGAANGASYGEDGTGEWSRRTALKERTARIAEGVRTRTTQRIDGGRGGNGRGGDGWDGGPGGGYSRRFDQNGRPLTRMERFKRYLRSGDWWRHWTWRKALGLVGGGIAAMILLGAIGFFVIYEMTPIPTAQTEEAGWQSSNVYLANGQLLDTFSNDGQTRQLLTEAQIPAVMTEAMTAAEDRNFYHEGGISVTGLLRAAYDDVLGGGTLQGGSTITMQYVKNDYSGVNTGQNIGTKFKEIFIAMKLGRERSKSWVMTNYLNVVPFGTTEYGLGAATQAYFNVNLAKPGAKLTVPQAAMLAAMPNAPGYFDPDPKAGPAYTALLNRYKYVLTNMARDGNITSQQASAYDNEFPKITPAPATSGLTGQKGYLSQMVTQELEAPRAYGGYGLTAQQLGTGGYQIYTTFSMAKVSALVHSVNTERAEIEAIDGTPMPQYDWIGSVLEDAKTGAIVAVDGGPGYGVKDCNKTLVACEWNRAESPEEVGSSFKPYVLATAVKEGMNVFTSKLNGYAPIAIPYATVAPPTAQSLQATEQMLSLLSPPPGDSQFFTPSMNQHSFPYNGEWYQVFDELGEDYNTPQPVNIATAVSSDPAFEDLAHRDGVENIVQMAANLGVGQNPFNVKCPPGATVAQMKACSDLAGLQAFGRIGSPEITFGEAPLTAVEQASTFATLADDGIYHSPHVIARVVQGTQTLPSDVVTRQVLSPAAAADTDWALSFDNNSDVGTAENTVSFRRGGIIGKTGTLGVDQNSSEAWFVGATPDEYSLSVALYTQAGNGATQVLNSLPDANGTAGEDGGAWPATIWNNFMTTEFGSQSWQPVNQVFQTVNGYPFTAWIQAKPKPLPNCKPGQVKNCKPVTCKPGFHFGQPCTGSNPSPGSSCQPFTGQCNNPSPNPSASVSPNPSASASPSPSASCTPPFPGGTCVDSTGQEARTTAAIVTVAAPPFVGAEDKSALVVASLAKLGVVT
jgi:membrane peptidoglycan carboxypeptidase